jgi:2,4-diketo-3-deoxy-L-fuconate hydrolase
MPCHVMRYRYQNTPQWGVVLGDRLIPLGSFETTRAFLAEGRDRAFEISANPEALLGDSLSVADLELLSPVTDDARVLCQGANYRQHMIESGLNPDEKNFNMFFNKSSASLCAGDSPIVRPLHVQLLDYEVELGLVLGSSVCAPCEVSERNLLDHIAGVVIANDVSARDVQIPQTQFFKGKSYRSFCPVGPRLCLLSSDDLHLLSSLTLELYVNDDLRQRDESANLVYKPAETLEELSQFSNWKPGDLLMTGTPSGCALQLPPAWVSRIFGLLPDAVKWKVFVKKQAGNGRYLKPGDRVRSRIFSKDGSIDLGEQCNQVVSAATGGR